MQFERTLRRTAELGIGLTAIATLILAGCGGGSSSTSGGSSAATTTTTITPYKGMFTSGTVTLTDANGNVVTLSAGGTINASGVASVTYPASVAYPLTVNVAGTYLDETAGGASAVIAAGSPLQGLIPSTSEAASGVPVTAVTHVARTMLPASGFSAASAVAAITGAASSVLGISSYSQAMLPPVFNNLGQTTDPTTIKLAALANVIGQQGAGADLGAKLHDIANKLAAGSAVGAVLPQASLNAALGMVNGGASSVVPAGTVGGISSFAPPNAALVDQIQAGLPTCTTGQVLQLTASGLQCSTSTATTGQAACQASGGMWDPVISVCLNGGNTGGGTVTPSLTCNTGLFAGGVRDATVGELSAYAQTYSGNTGSFDQNFVFTSSGNATLVFSASGGLTYNTQAQTVTSICYETAVPQLVVHFGTLGHVDLNSNGDFTGFDGTNIIRKVTAGGGGGSNVTNLSVPGGTALITGATIPTKSITSAATVSYTPLMNQPGNIITISEGGVTATVYDYVSTNQIGFAVSQSGLSLGLSPYNACATSQTGVTGVAPLCSSVGVAYDRAAGTVTFSNTPMVKVVGTCSASCVVNGTLAFAPQ